MLFNTEAVVIRTVPYGETHAIVTLLTPSGALGAMARGAKKPQSRLTAGVQLCVQGMYTVYQRTGLGTIQQVEVVKTRRGLHENLNQAAYAAYFCELATVASDDWPNGSQAFYNQFVAVLDRLSDADHIAADTARVWEAKVLRKLGASPVWNVCVQCGSTLGREVYYSPVDGGNLCGNCHSLIPVTSDRTIRVPGAVPRILESFSAVPIERMGYIQLQPQTRNLINLILRTQMLDFAGLSVKSRRILESLVEESTEEYPGEVP